LNQDHLAKAGALMETFPQVKALLNRSDVNDPDVRDSVIVSLHKMPSTGRQAGVPYELSEERERERLSGSQSELRFLLNAS
jgi:hypothetical protein